MEAFGVPALSTEERVLVSIVLGIVTVVSMSIVPRLTRTARLRLDAKTDVEIDAGDRPVRVGTLVVQRLLQASILGAGVALLLLFWGQHAYVWWAYEVVSATFPTLARVGVTGGLLLGAYYALGATSEWVERTTGNARRFNAHDKEIVTRIAQLLLLLTTVVLVLIVWRIDVSGLLVGAGALGIIVGYAARETLGSIFSGLLLMFSRPFEIGDWVIIGDDRGIVTDITIVNTRVRSPTGEHVIIPNTEITKRTIRNRSFERRLRFSVDVDVDYDTDLERARSVALDAVEELDIVAEAPFPSVLVDRMADSSIVLRVRFWVDRANAEKMWRAEDQVLEAVATAFDRENIHIPYPHQRFVTGEKPTGTRGTDKPPRDGTDKPPRDGTD